MSTPIDDNLGMAIVIDDAELAAIKVEYPKYPLSKTRFNYGQVVAYKNIQQPYREISDKMIAVGITEAGSPEWVKEVIGGALEGEVSSLLVRESHNSRFFRIDVVPTAAPSLPIITEQPVSMTVVDGENVSFTCEAYGNPEPTGQWQVDGVDIIGEVNTAYSFTAADADDGNVYTMTWTNSEGVVTSEDAVLTVQLLPVVTLQPAEVNTNAGETVTFTSAATGRPTPEVRWYYSDDGGSTSHPLDDHREPELTFVAEESMDGYLVAARWFNDAGEVFSDAVELEVDPALELPVIDTQPVAESVNAPDAATFTASATGYPIPTSQWQVDEGSGFADIDGETSDALFIDPTDVGLDGNEYRVVYTNSEGSVTSDAVVLTVDPALELPAIDTQPVAESVTEPDIATFTASATGYPIPDAQWQVDDGSGFADIDGETGDSLVIDPTDVGLDANEYRVVYTNSEGSVTSDAVVLTVAAL
ncbi:immunoglobulin subtype [Vibrio phage 1.081.O._10N.286.52.C2]|nr:immunoglobulin subtype [Vibrio phage 1.081.O._10N.286.52.C2]